MHGLAFPSRVLVAAKITLFTVVGCNNGRKPIKNKFFKINFKTSSQFSNTMCDGIINPEALSVSTGGVK